MPVARLHLVGYASAGLGLGEVLRRMAKAFSPDYGRLGVHDFRLNMGDRSRELSLWDDLPSDCFDRSIDPGDFVLYVVNPDQLKEATLCFPANCRRAALWFWELERAPKFWGQSLALIDELWTPSSFVYEAVKPLTAAAAWPGILRPVPLPLYSENDGGSGTIDRPWWEDWVRPHQYRFYFGFDCHSVPERKNPLDIIRAFKRAFGQSSSEPSLGRRARRPLLLIRAINAERRPDFMETLRDVASHDSRIMLDSSFLTSLEMKRLVSSIDAYVSLHRSEGLGLGIAEAMSSAKPCIATAWSGNLDFMRLPLKRHAGAFQEAYFDARTPTHDLGFMVEGALIDVPPGSYPHSEGLKWAQVEVESASNAMRCCYDFPANAMSLGWGAKKLLAKHFGAERFRRWLRDEVFNG